MTDNQMLPGEEGWTSSTSSSSSSNEDEDDDDRDNLVTGQSNPEPKRRIVNVHRADISTTIGQEGNEELQDLNVEVYDQRTYEEGVFEQVDKAISDADKASLSNTNRSSGSTDLMRVIHAQSQEGAENQSVDSVIDEDEQVLQLTRLQRLNKTAPVKLERIDFGFDQPTTYSSSRIPRLSTNNVVVKTERISPETQRDQVILQASTSYQTGQTNSKVKEEKEEGEYESESESGSEYKASPEGEEVGEDDDSEIDYETDDELGLKNGLESDDEQVRRRKTKKLQDDGDLQSYKARIKAFNREVAKTRLNNILDDGTEIKNLDETIQIEGGLHMPLDMWNNLFEHQRTGVKWLWELHQLGTGGILGDEMGLGKTIQMISFLTALKTSNITNAHRGYEGLGPVVLVCPATVMHQWLLEFRKWWPPFRVAILHNTGTFNGDRKNLAQIINRSNGVLIVSYPGAVIYQDYLHRFDWHYVILDEGHKIRNPDAQVTLACKRFRTPHRIILSGSPVQNNLRELWSIFDFIYPGKLGTLPVFMEQFATPITQGGYSNASDIQVQIAYKCACVLRDTIKPFLLRRSKAEVNSKLKLPDKSEQVLFCKLTEKQRKLYESYLSSPTVRDIKSGYCQIFVGLIQLRKICNHPDLFDATECRRQLVQSSSDKRNIEFFSEDETYGHIKKSGKMMVVDALLKLWKKQGHKVLLFTQSRQMLKIFERYLTQNNYNYLVMDGTTSIAKRQSVIENFNNNNDIFIFLLTTRVGGVGVNLIGANRIIIYDPDWNPSTDIQARERAWRIGQRKHVIIYRLLTAGTIEEKIYHRQVFKLYLTNRVLKNAKQKRFFKTNDLHELFTLGDNDKNIETKALFDEDLQINPETIQKSRKRNKQKKDKKKREKLEAKKVKVSESISLLSEEKIRALRDRAKRLSQMIALQYGNAKISSISEKTESTSPVESKGHQVEPKEQHVKSKVKHVKSKKQHVEYLVKQDIYKHDNTEKVDKRYERDDYILERLFKSSNVSGALKHDEIESDSTNDYKVVECEAEKVARDAIKALRESRRVCSDSRAGIPNWTGRNGNLNTNSRLIPKNNTKIKFLTKLGAPSTSSEPKEESLLTSIKKRNQSNPITLNTDNASINVDEDEQNQDFIGKAKETGAEEMADKMREYILFKAARSGESQTDEILDFFKSNFTPDKSAIFKALLYKMCEFQRKGNKGFWILKSEYRDI